MRPELRMTVKALRALGLAAAPLIAGGALIDGTDGVVSVVFGCGIVAGNQALAAASTAWSRRLGYATVATGYGGFALRMFVVFTLFPIAAQTAGLHKTLFVVSFLTSLAVVLTATCVSYARKTYIPSWRTAG